LLQKKNSGKAKTCNSKDLTVSSNGFSSFSVFFFFFLYRQLEKWIIEAGHLETMTAN